MDIGKLIRLNRIFSHPSGCLCSIAIDHFIGYGHGLPPGLRCIQDTLAEIVSAGPDAVTMMKGIAMTSWKPYAGKIPLILQSIIGRPDDTAFEKLLTAEEAIRLGADALAVAAFVHGKTEATYLKVVADTVREAEPYNLPVFCHIYPRDKTSNYTAISYEPEDIAWAVHCALELGVDVIKTPYCGNRDEYAQIVAQTPVPVVAAGGPRQETFEAALAMMAEVVASGARGATIGRNVWGSGKTNAAVKAFKAVIHDRRSPQEALQFAGW
jgi:DhnA family fructose-bisphosphate aldolase class Ia